MNSLKKERAIVSYLLAIFLMWLTGLSVGRVYGTVVTWTGSGSNDNWSNGSNWLDGTPPTDTDSVTFNATDSGNTNIVDSDFTIAGFQYIGNSVHSTDLNGSSNLQINGPVNIGAGYSGGGSAMVTWTNGGTVAIGSSTIRQGFDIRGSLLLEDMSLEAFVGGLRISGAGAGRNEGSLILGMNSRLNIDNSGWYMIIGSNDWGTSASSEGIGILDTRLGNAELQTHTMHIGSAGVWGAGKAEGTLMLGSNDSVRADVVYVGESDYYEGKGVLEAVEGDVDFRVRQLLVGCGRTGTGILRWDQSNPLYAEYIWFGYAGGLGILDVPDGGTCRFGSDGEPAGLCIGCNFSTAEGFDFTVKDPIFEAYLGDLAVGTNDSLILGSNSKLRVGQLSNCDYGYGSVSIGINAVAPAEPSGLLDTVRGDSQIHVFTINVGHADPWWSPVGENNGTFTMGSNNVVTTCMLNVGVGPDVGPNATGTVNLTGGRMAADWIYLGEGGTFNFKGGRLAVNTFNTYGGVGALNQEGGTLAPGFSRTETSLPGIATINGNFKLTSAGTLEVELFGLTSLKYDQVIVNGTVNLNADNGNGGALDLVLGFAPQIDDEFVIIDNDSLDPIQGRFAGLPEGSLFTKTYLDQIFTFQISYVGHTGNDVVLRMIGIQSPTNEQPIADAGDDQTVECACQTPEGTKVTLDGTGSYDPDDDTLTYTWTGLFAESPASGPNPTVTLDCVGEYQIRLVVNDGKVDSEPDTVIIIVQDTTPPEITCPEPITLEAQGPSGLPATDPEIQAFLDGASASDNCDPSPQISNDAPAFFQVGATIVTFTTTDASGNTSSCQSTVTVQVTTQDTEPPNIINVTADPSVLWPPNHKMVEVTVTVDCEDIYDPAPLCYIVGVICNEPVNGLGDGNTDSDWQYTDDPLVVLLRAERAGSASERVYTINVNCVDASGNIATATVDVTVPHDQSM